MKAARTTQRTSTWGAAALVTIGCVTMPAHDAYAQEAYLTGGTLGVGPGVAINLGSHFGLRADVEGLAFDTSATVDGGRYEGRVKLLQGGLYGDLFPFASSGFRLSAGVLINDDSFDGHAVPNALGNYVIGNTYVPAVGPAPEATITLPRAMPYIGLGYGHRRPVRGFGLAVDLGVAYGRPRVDYNVPPIYQLFATPQNIALEEQRLNNKVSGYRWYPVAQITLTYRF
ncbi:MAG TPA: hypothetical protein VG320_01255 [Paraburkholderia sp.]|jgi:hypothetical protein|uniref:hypothetical protein n=1 Tax=Paraburkholderia sp. TaxID=1926495 RepID=UPI002DE4AE2D|nr:hypothetical protein [Paraburkholderia sp.]